MLPWQERAKSMECWVDLLIFHLVVFCVLCYCCTQTLTKLSTFMVQKGLHMSNLMSKFFPSIVWPCTIEQLQQPTQDNLIDGLIQNFAEKKMSKIFCPFFGSHHYPETDFYFNTSLIYHIRTNALFLFFGHNHGIKRLLPILLPVV